MGCDPAPWPAKRCEVMVVDVLPQPGDRHQQPRVVYFALQGHHPNQNPQDLIDLAGSNLCYFLVACKPKTLVGDVKQTLTELRKVGFSRSHRQKSKGFQNHQGTKAIVIAIRKQPPRVVVKGRQDQVTRRRRRIQKLGLSRQVRRFDQPQNHPGMDPHVPSPAFRRLGVGKPSAPGRSVSPQITVRLLIADQNCRHPVDPLHPLLVFRPPRPRTGGHQPLTHVLSVPFARRSLLSRSGAEQGKGLALLVHDKVSKPLAPARFHHLGERAG